MQFLSWLFVILFESRLHVLKTLWCRDKRFFVNYLEWFVVAFHKDIAAICVLLESFHSKDPGKSFLFSLNIMLFCWANALLA